jgi:type II secretory pathway component PulF
MLFSYKTINQKGERGEGTMEAFSMDAAIIALQRQGFIMFTWLKSARITC